MALLEFTAEGGVAAASLNLADTGNGDMFTTLNPGGGGGTLTYTASAIKGALAVLGTQPTAANTCFVGWDVTGQASFAFRFYLTVASLPSATCDLVQVRTTAASLSTSVSMSTTGQVRVTVGGVSTSFSVPVLAVGTVYRIEGQGSGFGTAASALAVQAYLGDATGSPHVSVSLTGQTTAAVAERFRYGKPTGGPAFTGFVLDNIAQDAGTATPIGPTVAPPYAGGRHLRYFKNYDYAALGLDADERGFIVGQSRVGVSKLRSTLGAWSSIKGGFTAITANQGCRVVDDAWLEPEVSSLTLVTRDQTAFQTWDGYEVRLQYDGATVFTGVIIESSLRSEIGDDNTEEFTVVLTARGFEAIRNGLPAVGTAKRMYNLNGSTATVVQWAAGKARARAADITGGPVTAEDPRADVQLEESLALEPDVTGTQGELLADLAIRTGLLLDASSGAGVSFRSYQASPVWELEDEHLVSGYTIAVDRETATALVVTRKENDTFVRAYRAGTSTVVAERTISLPFDDEFRAANFAAYVPLRSSPVPFLGSAPAPFLAEATIPRHDDLALSSRLPIEARFRHAGTTYRGAIVGLSHTITSERWMMAAQCAPVHLITRVGNLAPAPPRHVKASLAGLTLTLDWPSYAFAGAVTASSPTSFSVLTAAADSIEVGDELRVSSPASVLSEDTIFRVTAKAAPSGGSVALTVTPPITASITVGDLLWFNDWGPEPDGGYQVWYQRGISQDNRQIHPSALGNTPVGGTVSGTGAVVSPLISGEIYRFTVYAMSTVPNVHSAPSEYVEVVVP